MKIFLYTSLLLASSFVYSQRINSVEADPKRAEICDKYVEALSLTTEKNKYSGETIQIEKFRWNSLSEIQGMWQEQSRWGPHYGFPYHIKILNRNGNSIGSGDMYVCISDIKTKKAIGFERVKN